MRKKKPEGERRTVKIRHSIKFKIMMLMLSVVAGSVALILLINNIFISRFYMREKAEDIISAYYYVDSILTKYDNGKIDAVSMYNCIERVTAPVGVSVFVVDSGWGVIYTSKNSNLYDRERVINSIFSNSTDYIKIIKKTDNYTVQKAYDTRMNDYYLEIWGTFSNGNIAMMRMPIQGIKESINISNKFIAYVGILVACIGIIVAYIYSSYITRPVKELSNVAERMSEMDFTARYTGKDKGEIGLLGGSMNMMSQKLEKNISQLKAANIELLNDIENKNRINESRSEFLSNVSHELKTPIALIQGYAEGLKEGISDDPESTSFYCDVIIDEASKMNEMVKKLLTLNQLEWNDEPVIERFDVTELIRAIVNANEIRISQKGIKVVFEETAPVYVWADEYKIEEVVTNYLSNAINHCDFEKIIKITIENKENVARISVFNTGANIEDKDIDRIWDKFYKADKARTREYGGNGIGLSIVKAIMEAGQNGYGVINHSNGVEFWFELDCKND